MSETTTVKRERWFFKCVKCKQPWALDLLLDGTFHRDSRLRQLADDPCPLCHQQHSRARFGFQTSRVMGLVGPKNRWYRVVSDTPCDGRCTNAKGPSCDCPCKGANHGTSRVIQRTVDAGRAPVVVPVIA